MNQAYTLIYIRVSSKQQVDGTSLDYQEESCRNKAKELGIPDSQIKVFREEGISGEDIDRPQINLLRGDVEKGIVKNVIVMHPDRLSRNLVDKLLICSELEKYNVELVFVDTEYADTPEGQLFFNIQSSIAEYELALIKKRTGRGIIKSVKNGKIQPMGVSPYGYDLVDSQLIINKEEAEFVKKIFQWYVYDKLTIREIGERLYTLGAKPKKSTQWSSATIQKILKSELYIGKYYYNRRKSEKVKGERTKSGKTKRKLQYRDKDEWLKVDIPRIIDDTTFYLASEQRQKNKAMSGNNKHEYLFRKMIRCGHCGSKWSAFAQTYKYTKKTGQQTKWTYRRYGCNKRKARSYGEHTDVCKVKPIRADIIEDKIWNDLILPIILNPEKIEESMLNQQRNDVNEDITEMYDMLKNQSKEKNDEIERTKLMFRKGFIDENELDENMQTLSKEKQNIDKEVSEYQKQLDVQNSKVKNTELFKKLSYYLSSKIRDDDIKFKDKKAIIDMLIDEIIITYINNNKIKITCNGFIDDIIGDSSKQPLVDVNTNELYFLQSIVLKFDKDKGNGNVYKTETIDTNFKFNNSKMI